MSWGGARAGAGRKKKPLAEKVAKDNPGKRPLTKVEFPKKDNQVENAAKTSDGVGFQDSSAAGAQLLAKLSEVKNTIDAPAFLALNGHEVGDDVPSAVEIFRLLTDFIKSSGCEQLVAPTLVEDFCHLRRSYLEAEYINRTKGRIMSGKRSPYVQMAIDYNKQALAIYDRIWNIISQNSEKPYDGGKNSFLELLSTRGF